MAEEYNSAFTGPQIDEAIQKVRDGVVQTTEQTLTEEQQTQARTNIGAASDEEVKQLSEEIADLIVTEGGDTLTWDGNTEGLVSAIDALYYKVSEAIPTMDDFADGGTVILSNGIGSPFTGEDAKVFFEDDGFAALGEYVLIVPSDNYTLDDVTIAEKGVYFITSGGVYVSSLTITGYTGFGEKTLKPEYLPEIPAEKLPGAIILYVGGSYLYADSDTSDASKRMTLAEFQKAALSGLPIWVYWAEVGNVYFQIITWASNDSYAVAYLHSPFNDANIPVYTAEYTA